MFRLHTIAVVLLLALAAIGCRAPAAAPAAAAPMLPTSAAVDGTNIVAIAPPAQQCCPKQTLPQFLGITGAFKGIGGLLNRLRNRLGAIWPGLEAKPEVLAISDPANLDSPNPAVAAAAGVKAEEDGAAQKAKAIAYLASVGCAGCYPGIEEALLAALDDCTELVRFETTKALRSTSTMPCKNCCRSACCGPKLREKLVKLAYETDSQGCYLEPSDRVRRMARLAIANCNCVPEKPGQPAATLPTEGPGAADAAPNPEPVPTPAAPVASVLRNPAELMFSANAASPPIGSGLLPGQQISATPPTRTYPTTVAVSYEQALAAYAKELQSPSAMPVRMPPGPPPAANALSPAAYQEALPPRSAIVRPPRVAIQRLPACNCQ